MTKRNTWKVVFSGVGGQGLVLDGFLLGEAVSIHEGRHATMTKSYGSEARGTFTKTDVIVSDEEIDFPGIEVPDVVIALAQVAYDRYADQMPEDSVIIYDSGLVTPRASKAEQHGYPITRIAAGAGGIISANLVAMGLLVGLVGLVGQEAVLAAIKSRFAEKPKLIDGNVASFMAGLQSAKGGPSCG